MHIVQIADVPNVLALHPSVPAKTFDEFLAYAKASPGKLNYASTGVGTSAHLSGFLLCKRAGIEATHTKEGADPVGGTPEQFARFVQREYEKWKLVVRESGATAE